MTAPTRELENSPDINKTNFFFSTAQNRHLALPKTTFLEGVTSCLFEFSLNFLNDYL